MHDEKINFHLSPEQAKELQEVLVDNHFFNDATLHQLSNQLEGYLEKRHI